MSQRIRGFVPILLISLLPTLLIWAPFFFRLENFWSVPLPPDGMATIVANYDGPLFIVVAKTFYNKVLITQNFSFPLPTEYYAAHFPMFPVLISIVALVTGFPYSLLGVTVLSSILATHFFHKFIKQYVKGSNALWLTLVFAILPARWLIVRSVGSSEPLFMAATIASIYYFQKKKYWQSGIWGAVAQLTRSVGILLFIAYALYIFVPKFHKLATNAFNKWGKIMNLKKVYPVLLIPLSLFGLFAFYKIRFNDFFAYFNSGDNIHLFFPPFQIFNFSAPWVGTFWLEEVVLVYLLGLLGLFKLIKQKSEVLVWYVGVFLFSLAFVSHRDVIRYALPIIPFLIAAWSTTLKQKEFKIILLILAIPIYLFSLAFISQNVMPISDWAPLL